MTYYRPPRTAGDVVPFRAKSGVPTVTIGGRKYVLSTDGGPLGDRLDDDQMEDSPIGARIIRPNPSANKWRYLWAYNTDRQTVTMWRVNDGNEKTHDSATAQRARILTLDKKGQINRVTDQEFRTLEREMRHREDQLIEAMRASIEEAKSGAEKRLDHLVREFFEQKVYPTLIRRLGEVEAGIVPFGFRPHGPALHDKAWLSRQQSAYVLGETFRHLMTEPQVEAWLKTQDFPLDLVDRQALQWAIEEVKDLAAGLLPSRPDFG